ncbi:hypothetical protein [Psychroflexus aestuariivivens]|uniref:hypothetical protein n=1 Tax=Psychroflexus aestuariivivens TaxID=1795040 RepID=UPI000FDC3C55|nr:hypothetical protein [Psychroflexus aestuariivivens]
MKYFIYFLIISAVGLMILSATFLNFENLLGDEQSFTALVGVLVCLCTIILLFILLLSKQIKEKYDG